MALKLVSYRTASDPCVRTGALVEAGVLDLRQVLSAADSGLSICSCFDDLAEVLSCDECVDLVRTSLERAGGVEPVAGAELLAPIPVPAQAVLPGHELHEPPAGERLAAA